MGALRQKQNFRGRWSVARDNYFCVLLGDCCLPNIPQTHARSFVCVVSCCAVVFLSFIVVYLCSLCLCVFVSLCLCFHLFLCIKNLAVAILAQGSLFSLPLTAVLPSLLLWRWAPSLRTLRACLDCWSHFIRGPRARTVGDMPRAWARPERWWL